MIDLLLVVSAVWFLAVWYATNFFLDYIERKVEERTNHEQQKLAAMKRISRENGGVWRD